MAVSNWSLFQLILFLEQILWFRQLTSKSFEVPDKLERKVKSLQGCIFRNIAGQMKTLIIYLSFESYAVWTKKHFQQLLVTYFFETGQYSVNVELGQFLQMARICPMSLTIVTLSLIVAIILPQINLRRCYFSFLWKPL